MQTPLDGSSRRSLARSIATWIGSLSGLAGAGVAVFALVRPDLMMVEQVSFDGQHRATAAELRHLADVPNGTTLWAVDDGAVRRNIERHPWVRSATAATSWMGALAVTVEEYEPVAMLADEGLFYLSADGVVFVRARSDDLNYPVLSGFGAELAAAHPELPRLAIRDALHLMDQLDASQLVSAASVSEVAFSRSRGFTFHLEGGAQLVLGHENYPKQLTLLEQVVAKGVDLTHPIYVDLAPSEVAIVRPLTGREAS